MGKGSGGLAGMMSIGRTALCVGLCIAGFTLQGCADSFIPTCKQFDFAGGFVRAGKAGKDGKVECSNGAKYTGPPLACGPPGGDYQHGIAQWLKNDGFNKMGIDLRKPVKESELTCGPAKASVEEKFEVHQ